MIAGFTITKIVIVQSLESHELQTGRILSEHISAQLNEYNLPIPTEFLYCTNYIEFLGILDRLTADASFRNEIPILHVECHGSPSEGLEFENGSTLSWPEVAEKLLSLNVACRFNLLAVFSACFGGYFLGQMGAINPAPCWGMVAPTETVDPGEILRAFRIFYSTFLRTMDAGIAISSMAQISLARGRWFGQLAELWFERLVIGYITTHCTEDATKERARRLYRQLRDDGRHQSIGSLKRLIRQRNRESLLKDYFNLYFMIDRLPENQQRFMEVKTRMQRKLADLRSSGKYVI